VFIQNEGQFDERIEFAVLGSEGNLFFTEDGIWLSLYNHTETRATAANKEGQANPTPAPGEGVQAGRSQTLGAVAVHVEFRSTLPSAILEGYGPVDTTVSFFYGNDPEHWSPRTKVWTGLRYRGIYPGYDLDISSQNGELSWKLVEAAVELQAQAERSAPPGDTQNLPPVEFEISGADRIALNARSIHLDTNAGEFDLPLLELAMHEDGQGIDTVSHPSIDGNVIQNPFMDMSTSTLNSEGFTGTSMGVRALIRPRNFQQATLLNPADTPADLVYSTYLGGIDTERGMGVAFGEDEAMYVTGSTRSYNFPFTPGAYDTSCGGCSIFYDIFVTKISPDGSQKLYSTFIGGNDFDEGRAMVVDAAGAVYLTGHTNSSDFPTTPGAYNRNFILTGNHSIVLKLNPSGTALEYSTLIAPNSQGLDIDVNSAGEAYVVGQTTYQDFPRVGSLGIEPYGGWDGFLLKLSSSGGSLGFSGYFGGQGDDCDIGGVYWECSVAVADDGSIYIGGMTTSPDFPRFGPLSSTQYHGNRDAFIAKVRPDGNQFVFSGYVGGSGQECLRGCDIGLDAEGDVYLVGSTLSTDIFPNSDPIAVELGNWDIFAAKFASDGTGPISSTILGGAEDDIADAITVNPAGDLFITGETNSVQFPNSEGAFPECSSCAAGIPDSYIARLNPALDQLTYFTYLGGLQADYGYAMAGDGADKVIVTGVTYSDQFPRTDNAIQTYRGGERDAFVSVLRTTGGAPPQPTPTPPPASTSRYWQKLDVSGTHMDYERLRELGCDEADRYSTYISVILDFGSPGYFGGEYGAFLPAEGTFATLTDIELAAKGFAQGYWQCSLSDAHDYLTLAIGTNNAGIAAFSEAQAADHGAAWASLINDLQAWLLDPRCVNAKPRCNMRSRVSIVGAIDIEAWRVKVIPPPKDSDEPRKREVNPWAARAWADAYAAETLLPYFNFGDCSNCPLSGPIPGTQWYRDHYWYLSWGLANAWPFPEIYNEAGTNAQQWQGLSKYSATCEEPCAPSQSVFQSPMIFLGALTQYEACRNQSCSGTKNTPEQGWTQLFEALFADPDTRQLFLGWSSDITWDN